MYYITAKSRKLRVTEEDLVRNIKLATFPCPVSCPSMSLTNYDIINSRKLYRHDQILKFLLLFYKYTKDRLFKEEYSPSACFFYLYLYDSYIYDKQKSSTSAVFFKIFDHIEKNSPYESRCCFNLTINK